VNKKKQKNFNHLLAVRRVSGELVSMQTDGSFLLLFFKKEALPFN